METFRIKANGIWHRLFAVAIFFGVSATTAQTAASTTGNQQILDAKNFSFKEGYDFDWKKFFGRSIYSSGDITLTGDDATGIRVDGLNNQLTVPKGTTIQSDGLRGTGVLISYGRDQSLNVEGNISAADALAIQYGDKSYDAKRYIPDFVTHLNFNTSLNYGGNISGAADLIGVDVMRGAKLYGGTLTLHDMNADIANGFTDATTGKFINHGTIAAGSPNTNLVINGDLISDGVIQKVSGGMTQRVTHTWRRKRVSI